MQMRERISAEERILTTLRYENDNPFPHYFIADDVFRLSRYLMRSFSKKCLDNVKRISNYHLSRGRKTIECASGMASENFHFLNSPIRCKNPVRVNDVIKAVCILHN
ncbi:uncharacterized protein LOC126147747 [Schistocerca cancellata]|uniref:uncharacterized protein LOC126147747 n=1 Tax=Schistocerca cancellata TaxID=274614 RepID=UPI0021192785|nr:uncharacterized protein LOC126147747 [Schistocerca cancellata]